MYIPNDIWIIIKKFIFPIKTEEMKKYDSTIKELNNLVFMTENIFFSDLVDQRLYNLLFIDQKIQYINKSFYKKYYLDSSVYCPKWLA